MCGKLDPTDSAFVQNLVDPAKRTAKSPVKKKDPVTKFSDIFIKLYSMFLNSKDLLIIIRDVAMILLSFRGFLRFNELSQLRGNDVLVKDCYLIIKIRESKTDQYRYGDEALISKGVSSACPYTMFLRYVDLANVDLSSDMFVFRPLYRSKERCSLITKNKPSSYTTARECIVRRLKVVSPEVNLGLHLK